MRTLQAGAGSYRLLRGSKLLYRQSAYLICISTGVDILQLIDAYLARWEVEVNYNGEKSVLGMRQAQVWNALSVQHTRAFLAAGYAAFFLAQKQVFAIAASKPLIPCRPGAKTIRCALVFGI